jgi:O-antigen/teichoic acid export membrane protein
MSNLIRCKACGYVTGEGRIKDVCPACGVPAKMFEPYTDPVSEKRRRIIDIHSHPIIVHFPQAFSLSLLILAVLFFITPFPIKDALVYTMKVLSFSLPFFVVLSFLTGLLDGKIRFRKVTTPFLKKKMIIGLIFFVSSIALASLAFTEQFPLTPTLEYFTVLTVISAGCTVLLGFIGGRIAEAKFPG